jgi:hypothetical protein
VKMFSTIALGCLGLAVGVYSTLFKMASLCYF